MIFFSVFSQVNQPIFILFLNNAVHLWLKVCFFKGKYLLFYYKIKNKMTSSSESIRMYWIYTLLSLVGIVVFLMFKPEWFWVMLPSFFTYFIKAMKWM